MMTQKSNEEIYKSLSEEERNVTVTSVELTDKAFKGKTDYSAIARLNGKVVFREGEYFSTLEGLQLFVFKNGKQITAYNWKIEDGTKNFRILYSTKTDKSGKIFFGLILRGDVPIIVGHTEDIEQETHYELLCEVLDRIENCGIDKGKAEGRIKGRTQVMALMKKLFEQNRIDDAKKASENAAYYDRLLKELGIN